MSIKMSTVSITLASTNTKVGKASGRHQFMGSSIANADACLKGWEIRFTDIVYPQTIRLIKR